MSASPLVTIMCDQRGCGQWWDRGVSETATLARQQLSGTGWASGVPDPTAPGCARTLPVPLPHRCKARLEAAAGQPALVPPMQSA